MGRRAGDGARIGSWAIVSVAARLCQWQGVGSKRGQYRKLDQVQACRASGMQRQAAGNLTALHFCGGLREGCRDVDVDLLLLLATDGLVAIRCSQLASLRPEACSGPPSNQVSPRLLCPACNALGCNL